MGFLRIFNLFRLWILELSSFLFEGMPSFWVVSFLFGFVDVDEATPTCPRSWKLPKSLKKNKSTKRWLETIPLSVWDIYFKMLCLCEGFWGVHLFGGDGSCCCFRLPIYPVLILRFITKYEVLDVWGLTLRRSVIIVIPVPGCTEKSVKRLVTASYLDKIW